MVELIFILFVYMYMYIKTAEKTTPTINIYDAINTIIKWKREICYN